MPNIGQLARNLLIPLAIAGPLWMVLGRIPFGQGGWMAIMQFFTLLPASFTVLMILAFRLRSNQSVKQTGALPLPLAKLVIWLGIAIFAFGIFMVDGGDNAGDTGSMR